MNEDALTVELEEYKHKLAEAAEHIKYLVRELDKAKANAVKYMRLAYAREKELDLLQVENAELNREIRVLESEKDDKSRKERAETCPGDPGLCPAG